MSSKEKQLKVTIIQYLSTKVGLTSFSADLEKQHDDNSLNLGLQPELCGFRYGPCYGSSNSPEGLILKPFARALHCTANPHSPSDTCEQHQDVAVPKRQDLVKYVKTGNKS